MPVVDLSWRSIPPSCQIDDKMPFTPRAQWTRPNSEDVSSDWPGEGRRQIIPARPVLVLLHHAAAFELSVGLDALQLSAPLTAQESLGDLGRKGWTIGRSSP